MFPRETTLQKSLIKETFKRPTMKQPQDHKMFKSGVAGFYRKNNEGSKVCVSLGVIGTAYAYTLLCIMVLHSTGQRSFRTF